MGKNIHLADDLVFRRLIHSGMAIKPVSLLDEGVVLSLLSSTLGRSPSAFGSRSWPSGPRPEQEKTKSCLPRKRTVESRAAETCRAHRSHYFSSHRMKHDVSFKAKRLKEAAKTHTQASGQAGGASPPLSSEVEDRATAPLRVSRRDSCRRNTLCKEVAENLPPTPT